MLATIAIAFVCFVIGAVVGAFGFLLLITGATEHVARGGNEWARGRYEE